MTRLSELKERWFIDVARKDAFPPQLRHPGTQIQAYTDGNLVEPIIDGKAIMGDFYYRVAAMLAGDDPRHCQILIAAMGIDPVRLLGESGPAPDAMTTLLEAAGAGAQVYFLASGQRGLGTLSRKFAEKLNAFGGHGAIDTRFPGFSGGHHQKFNVTRGPDGEWVALVSSADFFFARWDTPDHLAENPERPAKGGATHDVGLKVRGPAVADIGLTFAERWNDTSSVGATAPPIRVKMPTNFLSARSSSLGPHSVQVLRTYPHINGQGGYTWSHQGEFTIWAAYLNAIRQATRYIYIEDQYFYPFHDPPFFASATGRRLETDIVYQLGQALKRGVDVVALVPGRNDAIWKHYEIQQRWRAAEYLHDIATAHRAHGNFIICFLHNGGNDPVVHAKLMLVDDEYALVGSANICQRSIAYISELQLGVVDAENRLVRDLRLALWQEHLELDKPDRVRDPQAGVHEWQETTARQTGRLRPLSNRRPIFRFPYRYLFNRVLDPYSGPPRVP
ncbi:MAG: phospholipase D-like domain-containing protein [Anaerolineae bacterium]